MCGVCLCVSGQVGGEVNGEGVEGTVLGPGVVSLARAPGLSEGPHS